MDYRIDQDIQLICTLLSISKRQLAEQLGITNVTLSRWSVDPPQISPRNLEALYGFAYQQGLRLNKIKAQLFLDDSAEKGPTVLFHGSRQGIIGPLTLDKARTGSDFGPGFYCGESLRQSALFVSHAPSSSLYAVAFNSSGLTCRTFQVDQDWMLTIALYRERLAPYRQHPRLINLKAQVEEADYIAAPIADNRMFEIIDSFADGELTDEQCRHCLAATSLGNQYVFRTRRAIQQVKVLEHCYLCQQEKADYLKEQEAEAAVGLDKVKAARRLYRGQGKYIDEVLA